ncbi:MAG TPA: dynamin family protein [Longimicrobium sp.]
MPPTRTVTTGHAVWLATLPDIARVAGSLGGGSHAEAVTDLAALLADESLRIVIFGEFSVGKSTLLNALFGRAALPAKAIPTTGHATWIRFGETEGVRVVFADGRSESCPLDRIGSFVTLDLESRAREGIEAIEVSLQVPLLRGGITLIDTPGVNDAGAQTRRAERAVMGADLVLLVMRANQMLGAEVRHRAGVWMSRELEKSVVPVLNGLNQVDDARDRDELCRLLDAWAKANLIPVLGRRFFAVNALGALRHVLGINGTAAPADDFVALKQALERLGGPGRRELQSAGRARSARAVLRRVAAWNEAELTQLLEAAGTLHRARTKKRDKLKHALGGLERRVTAENIHVRAAVDEALREGWDSLTVRLYGESKETLEARASDWFDTYITEAARAAEERANQRLAALASEIGAPAPEPLTVTQLVSLTQRTAVHVTFHDNSAAVGKGALSGALAGATLGSVIPVVGTFIGGVIGFFAGGSMANAATERPPDYPAAYTEAAETDWDALAPVLVHATAEQFSTRLNGLMEGLRSQVAELEAVPAEGDELRERRRLQSMIEHALEAVER